MADYININGNNIPIRASDPTNPITGEVWYNLTTNALKGQIFQSAAWSTITSRNTTTRGSGQTGTVTAGLVTAGFTGSFPIIRNTEEYDGTSWTEVNDTGSDHYVASMSGTQTTAIIGGGYKSPPGASSNLGETYDGTNWTSIPNINTARYGMGNVGDSSLALIFGGEDATSTNVSLTEEWNGSAWTEVNDMNTGMNYRGSIGNSQTDCYAVGGLVPGSPNKTANVEQWDGTSWTAANSLNTATFSQGCWGTPTSGISVGGSADPTGFLSQTEIWDGTCFSISPASLNTARTNAWNGFGTSGSNGILAGGYTGTNTNVVEEFQGAAPATVTFSSS